MSFSLTRLTLYGLITSLETDLRTQIRTVLLASNTLSELLPIDLYKKARLRAEGEGYINDEEVLEYLDFGDAVAALNRHASSLDNRTRKFLKQETPTLQGVIAVRNRVMHARPLLFSDVTAIDTLTGIAQKYDAELLPTSREFVRRLRQDPYLPFSLDISEPERREDNVQHNLPIPDFDETGFLGRTDEAKQLLRACTGPWPLLTVVGEGGSGKTALALQVAYELLDDPRRPFDCIVWSTSKSTRLTLNEIQQIEGAITTSLGLFENIAHTLSGTKTSDPLEEVRQYLNEFKILLIIDNLETILDQRIIDFFASLTGKSKILVTSRVGTGAMNYPFPLGSLSDADAVQLLRATARVRRVNELVKVKTDLLRSYCRRMKNNPGFIKWFVSVVQCGRRPEEALANPKIFLDFCLSNVYEYTSTDAQTIARAMLAVPGKHAQPTLSYLTGLEADDFQLALQSLWSTNLISMTNVPTDTGYVTAYELNELPRLYILRNHAPSSEEIASYQARRREISWMHERLQAGRNRDRYDLKNITRRTNDDTVLSKYLLDALTWSKKDIPEVLQCVERAKRLDPSFFEVHRVEALINKWAGNQAVAWEAYENAVACEPNYAPLRYWYGGFLLRDLNDLDAAHAQFKIAAELDPAALQVALELGRTHMFKGEFRQADELIEPVVADEAATLMLRRKAFDTWLQSSSRKAQQCFDNGDFLGCLDACEQQIHRYDSYTSILADERILLTMQKQEMIADALLDRLAQTDEVERAAGCVDSFRAIRHSIVPSPIRTRPTDVKSPESDDVGKNFVGTISRYDPEKKFGFIVFDQGKAVFFHISDASLDTSESIEDLSVTFVLAAHGDKFRALDVHPTKGPQHDEANTPRQGLVKLVLTEKRFGFVYTDNGDELFFHANHLAQGTTLNDLQPGSRVTFVIGSNDKGPVADQLKLQ